MTHCRSLIASRRIVRHDQECYLGEVSGPAALAAVEPPVIRVDCRPRSTARPVEPFAQWVARQYMQVEKATGGAMGQLVNVRV